MEEISRECRARNCFRVLIEERLEGPRLRTIDVFGIVSERSNKDRGMFKAIAYVDINTESDLMLFAETVAINRAMPVAVFSTVADAAKWLLSKERGGTEPRAAVDAEKPRR
jgi:hypothetical protein